MSNSNRIRHNKFGKKKNFSEKLCEKQKMCVFVHFSSPTPKHLIASKCVYLALRSPYNNNAAINIRNINQEATKAIIQKLYTVRVLTTHPPTH